MRAKEAIAHHVTEDILESAVIAGDFSDEALECAKEAMRRLPRTEPSDSAERVAWIARVGHIGTVLDHFGRFAEAADFWKHFPVLAWIEEIGSKKRSVDSPGFLLARAKVWATLAWIQHVRRQHAADDERTPESLLHQVSSCTEYVEQELQQSAVKGRQCYVTLGQCFAVRGFLECDLDHAAEGDLWFGRAAEMYQRRLELAMLATNGQRQNQERRAAFHRVASTQLLGSAWHKLRRGALDAASFVLSSSMVFLTDSNDEILKAFARLMKGCILRAKAGSQEALLAPAIKELRDSQAIFEAAGHAAYHARASFELSLAYRDLPDYACAERFLSAAQYEGASKSWQSNLLMAKSRLVRLQQDVDQAVVLANDALRLAVAHHSPNVGEARVVMGEALLAALRPAAAIECFVQASEDAKQNSKLRAVCCVHLAQASLDLGRINEACHWLAQYRQLEPSVQNGFIKEFYGRVAERLRS